MASCPSCFVCFENQHLVIGRREVTARREVKEVGFSKVQRF